MIFRQQDLRAEWSYSYWGISVPRPSQWTQLGNYMNMYARMYVHTIICISVCYIYIETHEFTPMAKSHLIQRLILYNYLHS